MGYIRDSTELGGWGTIQGAFATFPSTLVVPTSKAAISDYVVTLPGKLGKRCVATLWLDGRRGAYEELSMLRPDDFAAVEVYPRDILVPMKFASVNSDCGAVIIWTKRGLPR
jgi:hypothetical protein